MVSWKRISDSIKNADMLGKHEEALRIITEEGDVQKAKLFLSERLLEKPKSVSLLFTMGRVLEEFEEWHSAVEYYDKVLEIKSDDESTILNKARVLIDELEEYQEGLDTLDIIWDFEEEDEEDELSEDDAPFYELRASALLGLERFDECEKLCNEILDKKPDNMYALSIYADSCYERKDYVKAAMMTEKILGIDPIDLEALGNKADILNKLDQTEPSLEITENIISKNSKDEVAWATKGDSEIRKREFEKAIRSLQNATLLDSTFDEAWFLLAKAHSHENHIDDALDCLVVATSLENEFLEELDDSHFDNIRDNPRFERLLSKQKHLQSTSDSEQIN